LNVRKSGGKVRKSEEKWRKSGGKVEEKKKKTCCKTIL